MKLIKINPEIMMSFDCYRYKYYTDFACLIFCCSSDGLNTPNSVIIPPVMSSPGVTSNAGFQQLIPEK